MKIFGGLLGLTLATVASASALPFDSLLVDQLTAPVNDQLKVATFNLKWFGLGGSMTGSTEYRGSGLRSFIARELRGTDVINFEEIVDVKLLQTKVLPRGWECVTYPHNNPRHQHVVTCARPGLSFRMEDDDQDWIINEVSQVNDADRARPAMRMKLVEKTHGREIARLVGVHLKAFPNEGAMRATQAERIQEDLTARNDGLPTVLMGDFNSFGSDIEDISNILGRGANPLHRVESADEITYRTPRYSGFFDHVFGSRGMQVLERAAVHGPCGEEPKGDAVAKAKIVKYNEDISDHCAVSVTFAL